MRMTQIRRGIFETNSSSTHSITIVDTGGGLMDTSLLRKGASVIYLNSREFGGEREEYTDAQSKAEYLAIYAVDWARSRSKEFQDILVNILKEQTGCAEVIFRFITYNMAQTIAIAVAEQYPFCGMFDFCHFAGIDHNAVEYGELDYIFEDEEKLRQFIFNPKSRLETEYDG